MRMDLPTWERRRVELRWAADKAELLRRLAVEGASYETVAAEAGKNVQRLYELVHRTREQIHLYERSRAHDEPEEAPEEQPEDDLSTPHKQAVFLRDCCENRHSDAGQGGAGEGEQTAIHGQYPALADYLGVVKAGGS